MSDDLIDRLQNPNFTDLQWPRDMFNEAADRIDALEAENKALREDAKRIYWAGAKDMRELLAEKMIAFGKSVHTEALPEFPARAALEGEKER